MIKFSGRYAALKDFGFRYQLLFDNAAHYTTFESKAVKSSHVWIQKSGNLVKFDGNDLDMSASILKWLVNNRFVIPAGDYNYNTETQEVEQVNYVLQWGIESEDESVVEKSKHYIKTHREISLKKGTFETLKLLWTWGMLDIL